MLTLPPKKFSGIGETLINAGVQVAGIFAQQQAQAAAKSGGVAKGLGPITAFVGNVLAQLNQVLQSASQLTADQALQIATGLRASLDNPAQVYQAKSGKDADVLRKGKADADILVTQIRGAFSPGTGSSAATPVVDTAGNVISSGASAGSVAAVAGINPNYLLIGGAGILLLLLLRK